MEYYDKDGNKLHLNDYIEIVTGAGKHKGYIKFFLYDKVRVNCMAVEFCVPQNSVSLNAAILTGKISEKLEVFQ